MNAVLYLRVSTAAHSMGGFGLDVQPRVRRA